MSQLLYRMSHLLFPTLEDKLFAGFPDMSKLTELKTKKRHVKVYGLSDLHADHQSSLEWIEQHCLGKGQDENESPQSMNSDDDYYTVFILPGDVATEIAQIRQVFRHLVHHYDCVCYIFGNHEAWTNGSLRKKNANGDYLLAENSLEKLREVYEVAKQEKVHIGPVVLEYDADTPRSLFLFPLQSWYHSGFDKEPEIKHPLYLNVEKTIPFDLKWSDFRTCKWPDSLISKEEGTTASSDCTKLAEAFAHLNEPLLFPAERLSNESSDSSSSTTRETIHFSPLIDRYHAAHRHHSEEKKRETVITFSHFVPRIELTPEKRFLLEPQLSKVIGSDFLEEQIRRVQPDLHLFGHTHVPIDMELDGIRYVQWPLGYSREAEEDCAPVFQNGPLCVFDSHLGDGVQGIPSLQPLKTAYWTEYYQSHVREPDRVEELAPWVIERLELFLS